MKSVDSLIRKTCPNCKAYELSFWDKLVMHNYLPSVCPKCNEAFVNSTAACLLWALCSIVFILFVIFNWHDRLNDGAIGLALIVVAASTLFVKPIPYRTFRPYGRRSWWKNVLIFVVLPLLLMVTILYLLVLLGIGM